MVDALAIMKRLLLTCACAALLFACSSDDDGKSVDREDSGGGIAPGADSATDGALPDGPTADVASEPPKSPFPEQFMPAVTGNCPAFAVGEGGCTEDDVSMICTFSPAATDARPVRLWMNAAAIDGDAPLVFFFHGLGGQASNAAVPLAGLGPTVVQAIVDAGGIVAAPEKKDTGTAPSLIDLPWLDALGLMEEGSTRDDDYYVMDEIVACAHQQVGLDLARIHVTGMSAGGLATGRASARRSGYLASAVTFSGGRVNNPASQDPNNKYPVMIVHGGPTDIVALEFEIQAIEMRAMLTTDGHFSVICNHGEGHRVNPETAASAWQFFQDHPYGSGPTSPYAQGLPASFPSFCEL